MITKLDRFIRSSNLPKVLVVGVSINSTTLVYAPVSVLKNYVQLLSFTILVPNTCYYT